MTSQPPDRAVVVRGERPGTDLLAEALDRVGMWERLTAAKGRRSAAVFPVLITAGMSSYDGMTGAVSPDLVEHIVDELAERGYANVTVASSRLGPDPWLDPPDAIAAAALGYPGRTANGTTYVVVDHAETTAGPEFPPDTVLAGATAPESHAQAAFRIDVASCTTHPEWGYALCLANLLGALPGEDRYYDYAVRRHPGEVVSAVLASYPPHVAVIDAVRSGHGIVGGTPQETSTIIAATDAVLADVIGATLMGLDPAVSPLMQSALDDPGLPAGYDVEGDLTPYAGWRNVPVALRELLITAPPSVRRVLVPALTPVDRERLTITDPTLDALNRVLAGLASTAEVDPTSFAVLLALCGWAVAAGSAGESWHTMVAKDRTRWQDTALGLDLETYKNADYDAVADYIEPLEAIVDALPADAWGMRRGSLDGSVLFMCSRVLAAPYDDFVARVDISQAIRFMNDYLGGSTVPVARDDQGRVIRQAERNVYLPQPNYLVLFGGRPIDVCKLETIRYGDTEQKICWRTVRSPNGTATYDDGSVLFRAVDGGARTEVVVHARQEFTLPLFWQVVDLDRMPAVKEPLVADAYRNFFLATLDNFEACYEGREFRIGRPWHADGEELPTLGVTRLARVAKGALGEARTKLADVDATDDGFVDEDGFRHFTAAPGTEVGRSRGRWWDGVREKVAPVADEVARDLRETLAREAGMWSGR